VGHDILLYIILGSIRYYLMWPRPFSFFLALVADRRREEWRRLEAFDI
jgi:hypothetical protein